MTHPENKPNNELENENIENNPIPQDESVSNPDELIIELDDSHTQKDELPQDLPQDESIDADVDEMSDSIQTPVTPVSSSKSKTDESKKQNVATKKPRVTSRKKAKKIILPVLILFVLIGAGYAYMYSMQPAVLVSWFPFLEKNGYVVIEKPQIAEQDEIVETAIQNDTEMSSEDEHISEVEEEYVEDVEMQEEEYVSEEEVVEEITEALVSQPQKHVPVQNIQQFDTPAWIISYASVSKNTNAIASVKKLRELGNSAGYYWMPDYTTGAPEMYKVYIGPFASKAQAEAHITSIQELEPSAYVLYVEGK